jgi:hypothetical protein
VICNSLQYYYYKNFQGTCLGAWSGCARADWGLFMNCCCWGADSWTDEGWWVLSVRTVGVLRDGPWMGVMLGLDSLALRCVRWWSCGVRLMMIV